MNRWVLRVASAIGTRLANFLWLASMSRGVIYAVPVPTTEHEAKVKHLLRYLALLATRTFSPESQSPTYTFLVAPTQLNKMSTITLIVIALGTTLGDPLREWPRPRVLGAHSLCRSRSQATGAHLRQTT